MPGRHRCFVLMALLLMMLVQAPGARASVPAAGDPNAPRVSAAIGNSIMIALNTNNQLIQFDVATPGTVSVPVTVTGLQPGENLLAIDFRPATDVLYGLGSTSRLYLINLLNGVATAVAAPISPALSGTSFGFDFNPVPDRIRVVSDADQNLRLNPDTGATITDTGLAYAAGDPNFGINPNIVASGYVNSFPGATTTTLYGIDSNLDILVTQNPPNNGILNTVGALGVNVTDLVALDIAPPVNEGYVAAQIGAATSSNLYTINLVTGALTLVGTIGGGVLIRGIAVAPAGAFRFGSSTVVVPEGSSALVTVSRPTSSFGAASVTVRSASGTATNGVDFDSVNSVLSFASGEFTKTIAITTTQDALFEDIEIAPLTLISPTGGARIGVMTATLVIRDDEIPPAKLLALTAGNQLLGFSADSPGTVILTRTVTGLDVGESLLGIDYRPANLALYGLGSTNRLYRIDVSSGVATAVGLSFSPALSGTSFGVDFNPVVDRIRVVSDLGQNQRLNPENGAIAGIDTGLAYVSGDPLFGTIPRVTGAAYTTNTVGAATTTLFAIDRSAGQLVRIGGVVGSPSPNTGQLFSVGSLSLTLTGTLGFDIAAGSGSAYAALVLTGTTDSRLARIDLTNGAASVIGPIGISQTVTGLSVIPGLDLAPASLPATTGGLAYSVPLTAGGGVGPYTFAATGALPPGLTLLPSGLLSGTITAAGAFSVTIVVTDVVGQQVPRTYLLQVAAPVITISPVPLPPATVNLAYSVPLAANGGTGPYQFSVLSGTLPAGLTLSASGVLSGTPTVIGPASWTVQALDAFGISGQQSYSLVVLPRSVVFIPGSTDLLASGW